MRTARRASRIAFGECPRLREAVRGCEILLVLPTHQRARRQQNEERLSTEDLRRELNRLRSEFEALQNQVAVSRQIEIRRWNVKKGRWEQQYKASAALKDSDPASRRPDSSPPNSS